MTTVIIYADSNDGYVDSDSTTYTTMRNGNSMSTASNDRLAWGQGLITGTYWGYQSFVQYTFSLNTEEKITAALLRFKGRSVNSTTPARYLSVMEYDWGGSVETADWRNSSSHTGTLFANIYNATDTLGEFATAGSDALITRLQSTSPIRVQLNSDGMRTGTVPTVNEVATWYSVDQTGTADDPVLVYTTVIENNLNGVLGAAVQLSDGTHVFLERSGTTITLKHHNGTSASTVSTLSTGTGASSFSLPTNGCGAQQLALTRDSSNNIFVVGARGSAPVTDIAVQGFTKGAGYSWTAQTVRTGTISTYVEGALNNFATLWANLGTGGSLLTMYSHTHGRSTGSANESGFCSLDANYVLTGTGSLIRSNVDARGNVITGSYKSGYHNHHMNETGTGLDIDKAVGDETRHYNYSFQATQELGENLGFYSTRVVMNSNGVGHSNAYTADQGDGWGVKDGNTKLRVIGVNTTDYLTCSVDNDSGYGPTIYFLRNTGTNTTWTVLQYADLDGEHASIPASATLSRSATWDLVYDSWANTAWFYYLNASDQRQLMRIGFNLTTGVVGSPVTVASNIGAAGCENSAIRAPRQRIVGQKVLIAIGSETSGGVHSTEYVLDDLSLQVAPTGGASGSAYGSPTITTSKTVTVTGGATGSAYGSPTITTSNTVTVTGGATASAYGSPTITTSTTVTVTGAASGSAYGQPTVTPGSVTISVTGAATASAGGQPTVTPGAVTVSPTGSASSSAGGQPTITTSVAVTATGGASGSAYGSPTITTSNTVTPTGAASASAVGHPAVTTSITVTASGGGSSSAYGSPSVTSSVTVSPTGGGTGSAYGTPNVLRVVSGTGGTSGSAYGQPAVSSTVTVTATGGATSSAYGLPTITTSNTVTVTGAASGSAYGQPTVTPGAVTVSPTGASSTSAYGSPAITTSITVAATGAASTSAGGQPTVTPGPVTITATGGTTGSGYGQPVVLAGGVAVYPTGGSSTSAYGAPSAVPGAVTVSPTGTSSTSAYGQPAVTTSITVAPTGAASGSAVGHPAVSSTVTVTATGGSSSSAYGAPSAVPGAVTVSPTGGATGSSYGQPAVTTSVTVSPVGGSSGSVYGQPALVPLVTYVDATGGASSSAYGQPTVTPGPVTISPTGGSSTSAGGQPTVLPQPVTIQPTGGASTSSTGSPTVTSTIILAPFGAVSASAFGQPSITTTVTVFVVGGSSESAGGEPRVGRDNTVFPDGGTSGSAYGEPAAAYVINPLGGASGSAYGAVQVSPTEWEIRPNGGATGSRFGAPKVYDQILRPPDDGWVLYDTDDIVYQLSAGGTVPYPPDDDIVYQLPAGEPLVWN